MYCSKCGQEIPEGATFCLQCGSDLRVAGKTDYRPSGGGRVGGLSIGAVALVVAFAMIVGGLVVAYVYSEDSKRQAETPRPAIAQDRPVTQHERVSVVDKTFPVAAQKYVYYTIPLKAGLTHVTGHFTAQGGSNDIEVLVFDQDGFTNFSNGHNARSYYNSGGYVTTGSFDLNLHPGTYYVVFNNARAMVTNKVVTAKIEAEY